jgi:hypothetical protein
MSAPSQLRPLSLAPGFSPVEWSLPLRNRFNGFSSAPAKPLKRLCPPYRTNTGLKPGANEKKNGLTNRVTLLLLSLFTLVLCVSQGFAQSTATSSTRFQAVEIFADSRTAALAAYQLEFTITSGNAKIAGIEGGEHPAFAEAPFYDPKAIQHERVIVAAFSTLSADKLPTGKTRVATIHLQITGSDELKFETKLTAAADHSGKKIPVTISATAK